MELNVRHCLLGILLHVLMVAAIMLPVLIGRNVGQYICLTNFNNFAAFHQLQMCLGKHL